jgi:DNA helicase-2/ATP-dependent DNA helicase PcrA
MAAQVTEALRQEIKKLNAEQRKAVLHNGNVVLRAGPGSGKTRTLVARAAYLLETEIPLFRGLACITYTNAAADEIRRRVAKNHGVRVTDRLVCSTVHSFCLNEILRGFSGITDERLPEAGQILDDRSSQILLQHCFDQIGIVDVLAQWRTPTNKRIRRAMACKESLEDFDSREVDAARLYEQQLIEQGLLDFEAMVIRALNIVRENRHVQDLLRARFPHIVVDEYQDLGGVLHHLVIALRDLSGITVFAVGDVDQSVYGFTGADAKYLTELADRRDFLDIPLSINYRSSQELIALAEAALGTNRGRQARADAPPGNVRLKNLKSDLGGLSKHANYAADVVQETLDRGVPAERVAILYPRKGVILDALINELRRRPFSVRFEKDDTLPEGAISRFVQRCASRSVVSYQIHTAESRQHVADILHRADAPSITDLGYELKRLRSDAGLPQPSGNFSDLRALQQLLDPRPPYPVDSSAHLWLDQLSDTLSLSTIASQYAEQHDGTALQELQSLVLRSGFTVQDLARGAEVVGKVVLTNYHSSKGREFDTVILPGLLDELIPFDVAQGGIWRKPNPKELEEQRRSFYVALTRAETTVVLITGWRYKTKNGYPRETRPSPFLVEMSKRLRASSEGPI